MYGAKITVVGAALFVSAVGLGMAKIARFATADVEEKFGVPESLAVRAGLGMAAAGGAVALVASKTF